MLRTEREAHNCIGSPELGTVWLLLVPPMPGMGHDGGAGTTIMAGCRHPGSLVRGDDCLLD